jgi:hypothetical protein
MGLDAVIYDEKEERQLACKRLGNVSQVAFLRESAARILGAQSLLVSRVLYDATHSGDVLTTTDLQPLAAELQSLQRDTDADVQVFARDMLELIHTATRYERPIHFV